MITLCKDFSELEFLPPDPFAARITAYSSTYGFDCDFALFWVQTVDGEAVAAISRIDGNVTLCCSEKTDYDELSAFLSAVGYLSITAEKSALDAMGLKADKKSYIVEYVGDTDFESQNLIYDFDKKEIYNLLCDCGFEMGDYNSFLADVCARLNKGTAKLTCIADGNIQACAFKLFAGQKSVLLGAVATAKSARGKGYASALVKSLASEEKTKKVFLFCRNDDLLGFYSKIGFVPCGIWAISECK